MTTLTQAYHAGYDAAVAGHDMTGNPFKSDSSGSHYVRWNMGWTDATSSKSPRYKTSKINVNSLFEDGGNPNVR